MAAAPASATFHLIKIREVHPDVSSDSDYVELQMYADFQNLVGGHSVGIYNSGGYYINPPYVLPGNVANGQTQRTVLIGNSGVAAATGVTPDFVIPGFEIPNQGTACWLTSTGGTPATDSGLDCVSFGETFASAPSPTGTGAPTIPPGKSVTRNISPGCPTFLEASDDTDVSANDFAVTDPSPRNNATTPTEKLCSTGPPPDIRAPNTKLKKRPPNRTRDRTPTFRFVSTETGSRFRCKLDGKKPRSCRSPFTTKRLGFGVHTLRVTAIDRAGNADRTPAKDTFRVVAP